MSTDIKNVVKEKYSQIVTENQGGCGCGCGNVDYTVFSDSYEKLEGYIPEADYGLGCGIPTGTIDIKKGETVLDLGSGAGNDCFVARSLVGEDGRVIGLDFTEAMVTKAPENAVKLGYQNVEFRLGDIENMPIGGHTADVVISNCVLNLVPDKAKAFSEIFRVLKENGRFSISDIVTIGELPEGLKKDAEMYAGCVAGALQKDEYLRIIEEAGFKNVVVKQEKAISLPADVLSQYMDADQVEEFNAGKIGIYSITVYAEKTSCCGSGCCS